MYKFLSVERYYVVLSMESYLTITLYFTAAPFEKTVVFVCPAELKL